MIIKGSVLNGQKKAGTIGFPTVNILNTANVSSGIYAGRVMYGGDVFDAVLYIGKDRGDILEAHLFGFNDDLYGKEIEVEVVEKIREDIKVDDLSILKSMIEKDCADAKTILETNSD